MSSEIVFALSDGRFCSACSTMGRSIISAFHFLLWIGSPFGFFRDSTTCLTCSMYLFTVRAESSPADIFSISGFTDRLSTLARGRFRRQVLSQDISCRAEDGARKSKVCRRGGTADEILAVTWLRFSAELLAVQE